MNSPLPPDNEITPEDLPLRHRGTRAREAERIRQEFVESRKRSQPEGCSGVNHPNTSNER
jgi:hypothetical protein